MAEVLILVRPGGASIRLHQLPTKPMWKQLAKTRFSQTPRRQVRQPGGNKLTMTNSQGKQHSHMIAERATMTCDSKKCLSEGLTA